MTRTTQLLIAAAAVLVVAVVGYNLLPTRPSSIGGQPTLVPTATATQVPTATPVASPTIPTGSLAPGTYTERDAKYTSAAFSFTVPAGWSYDGGSIFKGTITQAAALSIDAWLVDNVYMDACNWRGAFAAVGPTKADLVAALTAQVGVKRTGPTNVTLGGLAAAKFVLAEAPGRPASSCDGGFIHIWPDAGGNEGGGEPLPSGSTTTIYVIESGGHATAFVAQSPKGATSADLAERQAILASMTFLP
ncbi:MAG TPA: hypothetical protein VF484_02595 [Candidatus Limnocylindrales bacterium]